MHARKGAGPRASVQAGHLASLGVLRLWLVCKGTGPGASTGGSSSVAQGAGPRASVSNGAGQWTGQDTENMILDGRTRERIRASKGHSQTRGHRQTEVRSGKKQLQVESADRRASQDTTGRKKKAHTAEQQHVTCHPLMANFENFPKSIFLLC